MLFDLTLSFDNGPEPSATPGVLDVLRRRGIGASFFVIGQKLAEPAGLACTLRAQAEGHRIGNHTWSHTIPLGEKPGADNAEREISQTQTTLGSLADPARYFRPMGGGGNLDHRLLSPEASSLLQRDSYTCVTWNSVPRDWADPDGWVETALQQVAQRAWSLMVLHDLPTGAMRHLERFLDQVVERGGRLRQDYPPDCLPIIAGKPGAGLAALVNTGASRP